MPEQVTPFMMGVRASDFQFPNSRIGVGAGTGNAGQGERERSGKGDSICDFDLRGSTCEPNLTEEYRSGDDGFISIL